MSNTEMQEQQPAPDFTLPAVGSEEIVKHGQVHLADLRGKNVVLYFYPKDDTPGCTKEACSFRDANHLMQQRASLCWVSVQIVLSRIRNSLKNTICPFHCWPIPIQPFRSFMVCGKRKTYMVRNSWASTARRS